MSITSRTTGAQTYQVTYRKTHDFDALYAFNFINSRCYNLHSSPPKYQNTRNLMYFERNPHIEIGVKTCCLHDNHAEC